MCIKNDINSQREKEKIENDLKEKFINQERKRIEKEIRDKYLNDELINDGYEYQLVIKYLEYDDYSENLENELRNGNADVAFLGLGDGSNNVFNTVNSGLILELDEILLSDKGKVIYNAFPSSLWESVKCNGHIYSIPQTLVGDQGIYVAFNTDYISDETIENWDGSIDGIYKIVKNIDWEDGKAPRFQYLINDYGFEDMIGCEIREGLLYDYEAMLIENPLESAKFIGYLRVLEQMKKDGFLDESVSYHENEISPSAREHLEAGDFLVALSEGATDEVFIKDSVRIKRITPYLSSRVNGSIGISGNAKNVEGIVDFLGLLYGESKFKYFR